MRFYYPDSLVTLVDHLQAGFLVEGTGCWDDDPADSPLIGRFLSKIGQQRRGVTPVRRGLVEQDDRAERNAIAAQQADQRIKKQRAHEQTAAIDRERQKAARKTAAEAARQQADADHEAERAEQERVKADRKTATLAAQRTTQARKADRKAEKTLSELDAADPLPLCNYDQCPHPRTTGRLCAGHAEQLQQGYGLGPLAPNRAQPRLTSKRRPY